MSDALGDDFFEIFDVFLVETLFFLSSLACMGHILLPFRGKYSTKKKKKKVVLVVAGRQKVPRFLEGHRIVFYHSFQRPRHLPHPHPGMLHTQVVIAHLTECLVVNLEEALPHQVLRVKIGNILTEFFFFFFFFFCISFVCASSLQQTQVYGYWQPRYTRTISRP